MRRIRLRKIPTSMNETSPGGGVELSERHRLRTLSTRRAATTGVRSSRGSSDLLMVSALIPQRVEIGVRWSAESPMRIWSLPATGRYGRPSMTLLPACCRAGSQVSLSPERMPALYRSADVFLHYSEEETFGNVFVEAMACGIRIMAPQFAAVALDRSRGRVLLEHTTIRQQSRGILNSHAMRLPAQRQARVAKAAAFSSSKVGKMYREFLAEVIAQSGSRDLELQFAIEVGDLNVGENLLAPWRRSAARVRNRQRNAQVSSFSIYFSRRRLRRSLAAIRRKEDRAELSNAQRGRAVGSRSARRKSAGKHLQFRHAGAP